MGHCLNIASEREVWASLEEKYVIFCCRGGLPEIDEITLEELRRLKSLV